MRGRRTQQRRTTRTLINNHEVEGTPKEIYEFMQLIENGYEPEPPEEKPETKMGRPPKARIDYGKAKALLDAGWSTKEIADELGCSVQSIKRKFGL